MLILIGLRASGKSTLARALAARTGRAFVDLDTLTAQKLGAASPSEAFRTHGEAAFRVAELECLRALLGAAERAEIVALGGGTATIPEAQRLLKSGPGMTIVYLRATAATLERRLAECGEVRPALTSDPKTEVEAILARRDPLYLALADQVINVDALSVEETLVVLEGM